MIPNCRHQGLLPEPQVPDAFVKHLKDSLLHILWVLLRATKPDLSSNIRRQSTNSASILSNNETFHLFSKLADILCPSRTLNSITSKSEKYTWRVKVKYQSPTVLQPTSSSPKAGIIRCKWQCHNCWEEWRRTCYCHVLLWQAHACSATTGMPCPPGHHLGAYLPVTTWCYLRLLGGVAQCSPLAPGNSAGWPCVALPHLYPTPFYSGGPLWFQQCWQQVTGTVSSHGTFAYLVPCTSMMRPSWSTNE